MNDEEEWTNLRLEQRIHVFVSGFAIAQDADSTKQHEVCCRLLLHTDVSPSWRVSSSSSSSDFPARLSLSLSDLPSLSLSLILTHSLCATFFVVRTNRFLWLKFVGVVMIVNEYEKKKEEEEEEEVFCHRYWERTKPKRTFYVGSVIVDIVMYEILLSLYLFL